jgi:hypothetical protein
MYKVGGIGYPWPAIQAVEGHPKLYCSEGATSAEDVLSTKATRQDRPKIIKFHGHHRYPWIPMS